MRRLGMLVMAILVITGCNAIQPNMEETELLWAETEKNIQRWVITTKAEASSSEKLPIIPELTVEISQKTPELAEKPAPQTPAATPPPEQDITVQESTDRNKQPALSQTEQPEETPVIDWPYLPITCPPEPEPTPEIDWPYITAPEPPTYTPEPESTEQPQEQPAPTPVPVVPVDPVPKPMEPPADPMPALPDKQPSTGYAECSCGARLTPEEVLTHMKAHAMNNENHSYRAY